MGFELRGSPESEYNDLRNSLVIYIIYIHTLFNLERFTDLVLTVDNDVITMTSSQ